jgi:hypothetical protein
VVEAGRQKITAGERPRYRLRVSPAFGGMLEGHCVELPTVHVLARSRSDVERAAREEISIALGVRDDDFDVGFDDRG